jgi:hypothetical protein
MVQMASKSPNKNGGRGCEGQRPRRVVDGMKKVMIKFEKDGFLYRHDIRVLIIF